MKRRPDEAAAATDSALVAAVFEQGDEAAFRTLYRRHTPRLYLMVLRLLGGQVHDAEDVIQDTWLHAVSGLAEFRWEARFSTWLTAIGLNVIRSHHRWRASHFETPFEEEHLELVSSAQAWTPLPGRRCTREPLDSAAAAAHGWHPTPTPEGATHAWLRRTT